MMMVYLTTHTAALMVGVCVGIWLRAELNSTLERSGRARIAKTPNEDPRTRNTSGNDDTQRRGP